MVAQLSEASANRQPLLFVYIWKRTRSGFVSVVLTIEAVLLKNFFHLVGVLCEFPKNSVSNCI